jgi:multidrug efflux system membrane fusion protein
MFDSAYPEAVLRPKTEDSQKSSSHFRHRSVISASLIVLVALTVTACRSEEPVFEKVVRPVKAVVVHQQVGEIVRTFSGDIRPHTESALGFRVAGKIVARSVNVGDRVTAGQVIARLDDTDLVLTQNSARAAVASAKTRLAVASDALGRANQLQPKGYTPNAVVDQRKLEVDAAEAALEAAEALSRQSENATGYAILKADRDGIVTAVHAEAGQVVAAGTPIALVAESGDMEVALDVPEQDVTQLAIGQDAELKLWADPRITARGKVREIAGQASSGSRTYAVRVGIDSPPPAMRLGMTASTILKLRSETPHLPIPLTAITTVEGRKAVFVADRTTARVTPRFIDIDGVSETHVKVVGGLQPGEVVVTGGVQFLTDGQLVKLPPDLVQTASAPQAKPLE